MGYFRPLSKLSIVATLFSITFPLTIYLIFVKVKEQITNFSISKNLFFPSIMYMFFGIAITTVIGSGLARLTGNTYILMFLVIIVSLLVLICSYKRAVPSEVYPIAVLTIAFFLIFHVNLISSFLLGADIHTEYYFAQLTYNASFWDRLSPQTTFQPYNSMLSVTVLPVIMSKFSNLDIELIFKIIYPMLYLLIPLTLYFSFKKQTGESIAFLSTFSFMLFNTFYGEMLGLARGMIAELFLVLLILLMVDSNINIKKRRFLFLTFSFAIIVSQYSLGYLLGFLLLSAFFLSHLFKNPFRQSPKLLTKGMILSFFVVFFTWNFIVAPSASQPLLAFTKIVFSKLLSNLPGPGITGLMPVYVSPLHDVSRYLFYIFSTLIVIGIIYLALKRRAIQFDPEFVSMSSVSFAVMLLCLIVPYFAAGLNATRFLHLALFFLAPFSIMGSITLVNSITAIKSRFVLKIKSARVHNLRKFSLLIASILLISLFLFQVGFIYQISGDNPNSISLSRDRMNDWTIYMNQLYLDKQEVCSAKWLGVYGNNQCTVYGDTGSIYFISYGLISNQRLKEISPDVLKSDSNSYFVFGRLNVVKGQVIGYSNTWNFSNFDLKCLNKIYSNEDSEIYLK